MHLYEGTEKRVTSERECMCIFLQAHVSQIKECVYMYIYIDAAHNEMLTNCGTGGPQNLKGN